MTLTHFAGNNITQSKFANTAISFYLALSGHVTRILTRMDISKFKCWLNCETRKITAVVKNST